MSEIPPMQPGTGGYRPHRGATILVLGILGLVLCPILGLIAWIMGNGDLREMNQGNMDPEGRGLTTAGRICGMISILLIVLVLGIWIAGACLAGGTAVLSQ